MNKFNSILKAHLHFPQKTHTRADQVRVQLLGVRRLVSEGDGGPHREAEHAGDGGEPHVGDLVDHQVGERDRIGTALIKKH